MMLILFFNGLAFGGLGLASYLQNRQRSDLPLSKHLPWLTAFGIACAMASWADMFLVSDGSEATLTAIFSIIKMILQPLSGLFLLKFGWDLIREIPLPPWTIFLPGVVIVPLAYVLTYAATNFITPSPLEIPIDIWSSYLFYLPGSIMAGIGFLRQWRMQQSEGIPEAAKLMLGAGLAFIFEAFIVGLIVPAAPYAPSSYYNYNRVVHNAFSVQDSATSMFSGFSGWLDYQRILDITGLPIQFWRMLSSFAVAFFLIKGLDVFETIRKNQLEKLTEERDKAKETSFLTQVDARKTAEKWTEVMVTINRRIIQFDDIDGILKFTLEHALELMKSDFIGLALYNEDNTKLELKCYSTVDQTYLVETSETVQSPVIRRAIKRGQAVISSESNLTINLSGLTNGLPFIAQEVGIVGLELEGKPIGAVWAVRETNSPYSRTDMVWLEYVADQVVIAIQHALMTAQLQSLSITEERARIARDMHDGLAQILGYMNLQVQTLDALLKQENLMALASELEQMRQAVKVVNADVRENILSLRTTLSIEKGLTSSIDEYLYEFGIQTGIETEFQNKLETEPKLSSVAEVQLICIFQEGLANVRKHAQAKRVRVELKHIVDNQRECIHMHIEDDGIGFQQKNTKKQFGIKTMKERALSVGGSAGIYKRPGGGTIVECTLPCLESGHFRTSKTLSHELNRVSVE